MSGHTRRHPTKQKDDVICMHHAGLLYHFPKEVAKRYCVTDQPVSANNVFANINKQYTRPGALLKGIRIRENLTQVELAARIRVTQSDISQMENGTRGIGRKIARRIEEQFDVDYRSFLD